MSHTVRVERNRLRFMSAHMATWEGACEPLHGHNYQLTVEVEGHLTPDSWVIDFSLIKRIARERCDQIDHAWQITTPDRRRFLLPKSDVSVLPIDNTTVERIAEWFHAEMAAALQREGMTNIDMLRIEVEEAPGQSGSYTAPVVTASSG
jgi:6-pyruvoyltetrahydropterin/6-carboxytetrahydropterin synthase